MGARTFSMHSRWMIPFDRETVLAALADADAYPQWWPQVRDAARIDENSGTARLRSLLPVSLRVRLTREIVDPDTGLLRAHLSGDLTGWTQWQVTAAAHTDSDRAGEYTDVEFRQTVEFTKHIATPALWLVRPILFANHRYMMAAGRRGLIRRLRSR